MIFFFMNTQTCVGCLGNILENVERQDVISSMLNSIPYPYYIQYLCCNIYLLQQGTVTGVHPCCGAVMSWKVETFANTASANAHI
jgi:hypothetical protein